MATDVEEVLVKLTAEIKDLKKGMKKGRAIVKKNTKAMSKDFVAMGKDIVKAVAGALIIRAMVKSGLQMAKMAASAKGVETSFRNMAGGIKEANQLLDELRRVSKGTISDIDLMTKANQAQILIGKEGAKELPKLMEIARASAKATGETVEFMFDSIVLGLGRQSKLILDNLGIIVSIEKANADYALSIGKTASKLTDAEKKQAFLNATLKAGEEIMKKVGGATDLATDAFGEYEASVKNLKVMLGKKLLPVVSKYLKHISDILNLTKELNSRDDERDDLLLEQTKIQKNINFMVKKRIELLAREDSMNFEVARSIKLLSDTLVNQYLALDRVKRVYKELIQARNDEADALKKGASVVKTIIMPTLDELIAKEEEYSKTIMSTGEALIARNEEYLKSLEELYPEVSELGEFTVTSMEEAVVGTLGQVETAVEGVRGVLDKSQPSFKEFLNLVTSLAGLLPGFGGIVGAGASLVGSIFGFAKGGIVTKPTMGIVGEAGPEAVIPLSQLNQLGGVSFSGTQMIFNNVRDTQDLKTGRFQRTAERELAGVAQGLRQRQGIKVPEVS